MTLSVNSDRATRAKNIVNPAKTGYFCLVGTGLTEPTLARCLGETPHVSPLLRRILRLSGCSPENVSEWLLKCAIARGAAHNRREFSATLPSDVPALTDEEIAVALCLGEHSYQSANLRAAAQLLSSPKTNVPRLLRLARLERVEPVLHFIANVADRIDPRIEPWASIRNELPQRPTPSLVAPRSRWASSPPPSFFTIQDHLSALALAGRRRIWERIPISALFVEPQTRHQELKVTDSRRLARELKAM